MSGITFKDYMSVSFSVSGKLLLSDDCNDYGFNDDCNDYEFRVYAESFPDFVMQLVNLGMDVGRHSNFDNPRIKFVILD